jgi:CelD/BcsL family acetyltransferase involved in cellulose biosynthesis
LIRLEEITTVDGFNSLREVWDTLLERSKDDSIFLTWENMATSVKYLEQKSLRILCGKENDRIISIAPLRKSHYTINAWMGYDVIEPLAYRDSDFTGLVLAGKETECLRAFLKYLFNKNDWDFVYLYDLPETSSIFRLLNSNPSAYPMFGIEQGRICPYLTIPASVDDLMSGLSAKFRKNLRRSFRDIQTAHGKIALKKYDEFTSLDDALNLFFTLHQKRCFSKGTPGVFATQKVRDMFANSAKLFAEKDWLALYFLTVNDNPIAVQLCLEYKDKMHYGLGGFDPVYSSYSIGNLIIYKMIEKCIDKGITEYDFMKGEEEYKFKWSQQFRKNLGVTFVNTNRVTSKMLGFGISVAKRMKMEQIFSRIRLAR